MKRTLIATLLAAMLSLGSTGCIKQMLTDGQIESTRKGSVAVDTVGDYEVANAAAFAGLAQFEGMHYLAPDNEDALFLLTKGWAGATFAFIEDQMEQAEDSEGGTDGPLYLYHQARARAGYERAVHYGIELLEKTAPGFKAATKNDDTMKAWLQAFDSEDDVPYLFWTGYAWMSKTNIDKDQPAVVAELFIGIAMIERALQLDEDYLYGTIHVAKGAYHARSAMAELDESKKHFERAIAISGGKALVAKLNFATRYYCNKGDKTNYVKLLNEVVAAGDVLPQQRLQNTIAKRRAKRYLSASRMSACGF
ncbi:MAG: TRAP transporter TatT component family protein [Polyangiaceae bacterium]